MQINIFLIGMQADYFCVKTFIVAIIFGERNRMNDDKNYDIKNAAIWVGAGISIDAPASLPSGYALTKFVFDKMILGKDKFLQIWNQINDYEENF